jgi:hypothetical protein
MWYGPKTATSYSFDAETVVNALLESGWSNEEVWPLLCITKTALEKGLKKIKRQDLLDPVLATGECKVNRKYDFYKSET